MIVSRINNHIQQLHACLERVHKYMLTKMKNNESAMVADKKWAESQTDNTKSAPIDPLFRDMTEPKQEQVGFLLPLTCGHNRHPNQAE